MTETHVIEKQSIQSLLLLRIKPCAWLQIALSHPTAITWLTKEESSAARGACDPDSGGTCQDDVIRSCDRRRGMRDLLGDFRTGPPCHHWIWPSDLLWEYGRRNDRTWSMFPCDWQRQQGDTLQNKRKTMFALRKTLQPLNHLENSFTWRRKDQSTVTAEETKQRLWDYVIILLLLLSKTKFLTIWFSSSSASAENKLNTNHHLQSGPIPRR